LDEETFRDARDAVELSLGSAFAGIDDARQHLDRLATLVNHRSEVDGLRGALELVAYAIEGLAVAIGQITPDGERRR
jgi:hypothetical protein